MSLRVETTELRGEMEVVIELMKQAIAQNASMVMDQEEYASRYNALAERYQNAAVRYKIIEVECAHRTSQRKMLTSFTKQKSGELHLTKHKAYHIIVVLWCFAGHTSWTWRTQIPGQGKDAQRNVA